jgi:hypothetical protein
MNNKERKRLSVILLGEKKYNEYNENYLKKMGMMNAPEYFLVDNPEYRYIVGWWGLQLLRVKVWIRRLLKK